ncbi:MAG: hypothetical protein GQ574_03440 [Crocinitomix sp.]|nr:hypothetical protein [Crocinitomix sp.]
MIKLSCLFSLLLISFITQAQEVDLIINSTGGEASNFETPVAEISKSVVLNGKTYFAYESLEAMMVIMTDIKRNIGTATFFELDEITMKLTRVTDKNLLYELFIRTHYKTEFNRMLFDDKWIYSENYSYKDRADVELKTVDVFRYENGVKYNDTLYVEKRSFDNPSYCGFTISDEKTQKGLLYTNTQVDTDFAKLFFIEIDHENEKLSTNEKVILYSELGFEYEHIELLESYDNDGMINGEHHITLFFNIDKGKKLGVSTIYIDFENETYHIRSEEIIDPERAFPEGMYTVYAKRQFSNGELTYFMEFSDSKNVYMLSLKSEGIETAIFRNAGPNLACVFKEADQYIFIYDGLCEIDTFAQESVTTLSESFDFDIVVYEDQKAHLYRQSLHQLNALQEYKQYGRIHAISDQNISDGITFYYSFKGDAYEDETDYNLYKFDLKLKN